jgi:hypothetical protein
VRQAGLDGVPVGRPDPVQSMGVTTGARWSGINTTCMPSASWNMWPSNNPADARAEAPVVLANPAGMDTSCARSTPALACSSEG